MLASKTEKDAVFGTLLFNVDTFRAMQVGFDTAGYNRLVWTPDTLGCIFKYHDDIDRFRAENLVTVLDQVSERAL